MPFDPQALRDAIETTTPPPQTPEGIEPKPRAFSRADLASAIDQTGPFQTGTPYVPEYEKAQARAAAFVANQEDPEATARVLQMARDTGLHPQALTHPKDYDWAALTQKTETAAKALDKAPALSKVFTQDPWFARVAADTLVESAEIERTFRESGFFAASQRARGLEDRLKHIDREAEGRAAYRMAAPPGRALPVALAGSLASGVVEFPGMVSGGLGQAYDISARGIGSALLAAGVPESVLRIGEGQITSPSRLFFHEPSRVLKGIAKDLRGDEEGYVYDMVAGLGQFAAQALGYVLTGGSTTGVALLAQGMDVMSEGVAKDPAPLWQKDLATVLAGVATTVTEKASLDVILNRKVLRDLAAGPLGRVLFAGLVEGTTEVSENILHDTIRKLVTNPEAEIEIAKAFQGEGAVGVGVGAVARALVEGALHVRARGASRAAKDEARELQDLFKRATEHHLRARDPESFKQLLGAVTDNATVFIDRDRLEAAAVEAGLDPEQVPSLAGSPDEGVAGPGVEVPVSELLSLFAGTAAEGSLVQHVRKDADSLSLAETQEQGQQAVAFFQAEAERIIAAQENSETIRTEAATIEAEIANAVLATGTFGPDAAKGYGKLVSAFYSTVASRLGITPLQLRDGWTDAQGVQHRGYNLRIAGAPDTTLPDGVFTQRPAATRETFTAGGIDSLLSTRDWVAITAENPNGQALDPETNAARQEQMRADLDTMGIEYIEGSVGRYNSIENPFILLNVTPRQAVELARKYDQESVLTPAGLVYQDGTVEVATGLTKHETPPEDYYTTLPDGTLFTVDLDFSRRIPLSQTPYGQELEGLAQGIERTNEQIARAFEDWAANDPEAVDRYIELHGFVVDPDRAKELSPEYRADPMRMARVVHEGSSILAKRVYAHLLKTAPAGASVVFSAGGGGSGKTETLHRIPSENVGIVYDSTLGRYDSAKSRVEQALAAGRGVTIAYTNRPVMDAWKFALHRPRVVPAADLAEAHVGASDTIRRLATEYAGDSRVAIVVMNNMKGPEDIALGFVGDVYSYDYNSVVEDLVAEARRQYEQGQITEERFRAATRESGVGGRVGSLAAEGGREVRVGRPDVGGTRGRGVAEARGDGEALAQSVSTRTPSVKAGRPDPHLSVGLDVDYELLKGKDKGISELVAKFAAKVKKYPAVRITARKPEAILEQFVEQVKDNLLWLHDQIDPEIRQRSKAWYDGGRAIIDYWTEKYEGRYTDAQLAGVLASMSPQMDWNVNVSLAERILDTWTEQQGTAWSAEMSAEAAKIAEGMRKRKSPVEPFLAIVENIQGKTLSALTDPLEQAVWIRIFDQASNPRTYRLLTPEGGFSKHATKKGGERALAAWANGHGPIAKSIRILQDGSIPNISRQLGGEHKVRNFYNNLFDPLDPKSVTIDTHAVAAGLLTPLSGGSIEVGHSMGAAGGHDATGLSGTYVLYAEAYRRAAAERGLLAREMQSIAWEALRALFTPSFKSRYSKDEKSKVKGGLPDQIEAILTDYRKGANADETRQRIAQLAGGFAEYDWAGSDPGLAAGQPGSTYKAELLERSRPDRAAGRRVGDDATGGDPGSFAQTGRDRLTRPPVNEDGTVTLQHYGKVPALGELDPGMSGTGLRGLDLRRRDSDPDNWQDRTYYGMAVGQPGGYVKESGVGPHLYEARVPADKLYDMARDPDGLRPKPTELGGWDNATSVFEKRIKEAGYTGYWVASPQLGLTAAVFQKLPAKQVESFAQRQTETEAFKRWFGDSKAVTALNADTGRPVESSREPSVVGPEVFYHTTTSDFDTFEVGRLTFNSGTFGAWETTRAAIFVTNDLEASEAYGKRAGAFETGARVMPVYVRAESPLDLSGGVTPEKVLDQFESVGINPRWLYRFDWSKFDDEDGAAFVAAAKKLGYDSVIFNDENPDTGASFEAWAIFEPNQIKSAVGNQGTFDPSDLSIVRQDRRAEFVPSQMQINLLEAADLSSFLHEAGHFFLTVYTDLAAQPDAPIEIRRDMEKLLDWIAPGQTPESWAALTLDQQREGHEKFAESFEQYLFTGQAPKAELQGFFRKFASWLGRVYGSLQEFLQGQPRATLNPEIAAVMDRMLASDTEISAAREARNYTALFETAADAGLSAEEFARYLALDDEQRLEAQEVLRTRSLRDMQWVRNLQNRTIAKLQAENREKYKALRAEVEEELREQPVYRAIEFLRKGTMLDPQTGEEIQVLEGNKLSAPDLETLFPPKALGEDTPWKTLGYGRNGLLAKEGLHPDLVAQMFGFPSGRDLVQALLVAPRLKDAVDALTDQRMVERYGDLFDQNAVERAADEAIHNQARARMVATELSALRRELGSPRTLLKAAKEFASQIVGSRTARTLKPWQFAAAETRAGKAALEALRKGDAAKAAEHKRTELLNHAAAKEAYETLRAVEAAAALLRGIVAVKDDNPRAKSRDMDTVNAIRAVLGEYGLGREVSRRKARGYLEALKSNDPTTGEALSGLFESLTEDAKPWQELTTREFLELTETIKDLWAFARRQRQVEVEGNRIETEQIAAELVRTIHERGGGPKAPIGRERAVTKAEARKMTFQTVLAKLRRVSQWAEAMDGGPMGAFRKYIWFPVKDAADRYRTERALYIGKRYGDLLKTIADRLKPGAISAPELGYTFGGGDIPSGRMELLHAVLHTGNTSNKRKLLLGRGWATERADGSLDTSKWDLFMGRMFDEGLLTKRDFDFVQGVWDLLEELKSGAQKAHKTLYGRYFDEVTADQVVTPFGTYRGGYVPAAVDTRAVLDGKLRELAQVENENLSYAFPNTNRGFTKSRTEYNKPLALDLRLLSSHIDKVLLFTHMQPAVSDVHKLLRRPDVSQALNAYDSGVLEGLLLPWLNRSVRQIVEEQTESAAVVDGFLRRVRRNAGMGLMFGNLINTLQQFTSLSIALVKVPPGQMARAAAHYMSRPRETVRFTMERSSFMHERLTNQNSLMYDQVQEILVNPSVYEKVENWTARHAYIFQVMADRTIAPVVWLGAYNNALETAPAALEGEALETYARRIADAAVQETQMDQTPEGIAAFEAGSAWRRMFTQFAGFFNMTANTIGTELAKAGRLTRGRKVMRSGYVIMFAYLIPAVMSELIAMALRGQPDDDEGDGYLDDWLAAVGWGTVRFGTAMIPFAGQGINAVLNRLSGHYYDERVLSAPAVSVLESALRMPISIHNTMAEDGSPSRAVRDTAMAITAFTGLPAAPLARPVSYLSDVASGHVQPTGPFDLVRGTITGVASPQSK